MVSHMRDVNDPLDQIKGAFQTDDAASVKKLLEDHPALRSRINEPLGPFDSPPIVNARSPEMVDVLLDAGADLNAKSLWWAGGFGLLHGAPPEVAAHAIKRGAIVDIHAAARLALMDRLRELVTANPESVHERGGDGQTPLHFAKTREVAEYLLDHGADINALDIDHESTPAQWMLDSRQDVARYLIAHGCKTDILMVTAVGDIERVRKHLAANPACIGTRVNHVFFPMSSPRAGGTIYQWTLGFHVFAHQVARKFGHEAIVQLLFDHSPPSVEFLAACWLGDEARVQLIRQRRPNVVAELSGIDRHEVAQAARNNEITAVRLMLEGGLPVDAPGQHHGTPLHWACFHGNAEMARVILRFGPPLEATDRDFHATPLGWAIHGSENGWYCQTGDYAGTVDALLSAGAKLPAQLAGSPGVREALRRHGMTDKID